MANVRPQSFAQARTWRMTSPARFLMWTRNFVEVYLDDSLVSSPGVDRSIHRHLHKRHGIV